MNDSQTSRQLAHRRIDGPVGDGAYERRIGGSNHGIIADELGGSDGQHRLQPLPDARNPVIAQFTDECGQIRSLRQERVEARFIDSR